MSEETLIVLGAGPKAAAIVAKWAVLRQVKRNVPRLVIVERGSAGAHWSGREDFGYNDGSSRLGTPPQKDVGYPYFSSTWTDPTERRDIQGGMVAYSWQSYLIERGAQGVLSGYWDWFDRGGTWPDHRGWADYLDWVFDRANRDQPEGLCLNYNWTVDGISINDAGRWVLTCANGHAPIEGDGLVITGHGRPKRLAAEPPNPHERVLNGQTYWQRANLARVRNQDGVFDSYIQSNEVAIIGLGGTASGIAEDLLQVRDLNWPGNRLSIKMIGREGVMYSRGEGYLENYFHSHPSDEWKSRGLDHRRNYVRRTDKGVFSLETLRKLDLALNVQILPGDVTSIVPNKDYVTLKHKYQGQTKTSYPAFVVNAVGFDPLWFIDLFDASARHVLGLALTCPALAMPYADLISPRHKGEYQAAFDAIEVAVDEDLSILKMSPRLHLPMLAGLQEGPGFPSLRALGLLSDRILRKYV